MRLSSVFVLAVVMSSGAALASPSPKLSLASVDVDGPSLDSQFSVTSQVQVPGKTLKPGTYTILLKDHLADRVILQVTNSSGKVESTFLGVFRSPNSGSGAAGPIRLQSEKGKEALQGFTFPGGRSVQFVYPKAEAAALTSKTNDAVLAIDPPSDNLHIKGNELSKQDAQIVTLWSLQVTPLANGQKGIAAKKYEGSSEPQTAAVSAPVPPAPQANTLPQRASVAPVAKPMVKRVAPKPERQMAMNRVPALKALPHTASNMPLLLVLSLCSLGATAGLRMRRNAVDA